MKKILIIVAIALVLIVVIVVNVAKQRKQATKVTVEAVERHDLVELVSASGKIQPKISVDVSADISGKIIEVAAEEGDVVEPGDLLLRIDPKQYREAFRSAEAQYQSSLASLNEAEARLEQQELEWRRIQFLHEKQDVSDREYESAQTSLKLAQAQLTSAQRLVDQTEAYLEQQRDNLDKTEIRAPMAGVIVRRNADVGEMAIQSSLQIQVLMVVADLAVMEVEVDVDETEIPRVAIDQTAEVEIDAFPDSTFQGRLTEIANSPRESGGDAGVDFRVVITLDRAYPGLRPGLSATAEITTAERDSVLGIPIQALTLRTKKNLEDDLERFRERLRVAGLEAEPFVFEEGEKELEGVMRVQKGRALFVPVETGIAGDKHFEVLSGLEGGEEVVTAPMRTIRTLQHGQKVKADKEDDEKKKEGEPEPVDEEAGEASGDSVKAD